MVVSAVQGASLFLNGPDCKYSALFDARPAFDALREAFLIFADPNSQAVVFTRLLSELGVPATTAEFIGKLRQWNTTPLLVHAPVAFNTRAWNAYLDCIRQGSYFFSVDELLGICSQARVRVLVFKETDRVLQFAGGNLCGDGPVLLTKLVARGQCSVRI